MSEEAIVLRTADIYLRFPEIMEEEAEELDEFLKYEHIVFEGATKKVINLQEENQKLKETIKNIKEYIHNNYNQEKRYNHELKAWIRCDDEILEMIEEVEK